MSALLQIADVSVSYHSPTGEIPALSHLSFSLEQGEFAAIVGPSGCGKSTLLNLVAGLMEPESGTITLDQIPIRESATQIGYMLQKDHLFEWRTIYGNVMLGPEINGTLTHSKKDYVHNLLDAYGLSAFEKSRPSQLSGGMRQRAALIRTLVMEPSLLLLDEPFSALDYQTRLSVSDDIGRILKKEGTTALLVTHDISEAISMADRVLVLSPRPATLKADIPIHLSVPERTPLASRNAPEFKDYFNQIWKELTVCE